MTNNCYIHATGTVVCDECKSLYVLEEPVKNDVITLKSDDTSTIKLSNPSNFGDIVNKDYVDNRNTHPVLTANNFARVTKPYTIADLVKMLQTCGALAKDTPIEKEKSLPANRYDCQDERIYEFSSKGVYSPVNPDCSIFSIFNNDNIRIGTASLDTDNRSLWFAPVITSNSEPLIEQISKQEIVDCLVELSKKNGLSCITCIKFETTGEMSPVVINAVINCWLAKKARKEEVLGRSVKSQSPTPRVQVMDENGELLGYASLGGNTALYFTRLGEMIGDIISKEEILDCLKELNENHNLAGVCIDNFNRTGYLHELTVSSVVNCWLKNKS